MSFVHLNVASAYSSHYGVNRPEHLVQAAAAAGFDALAITDRDGLYGAVKHIGSCIASGLSPIVGVNLSVVSEEIVSRVVILAHGNNRGRGWSQLCRIISKAHQHKSKNPQIEISDLAFLLGEEPACSILLGGDSFFAKQLLTSPAQAARELGKWKELFPKPNILIVEITNLLTEPGSIFSEEHSRKMLELAISQRVPAVLTNSVRYLQADDALTADVLDSARHLEPLGLFRLQPNAQAWLKPAKEMAKLALEITEDTVSARRLISSTLALADLCRLDPVTDCGWGVPKTPEQETLGITENPFEVLWQKSHAAISWRYPGAKASELAKIQHRLSKELIAINQLGFATYFLTVADVAQMIRDMKIRIAARGSGAGSLVNYLLGISGVDPISEGLLFERFLSTERSTLPDIDIDVESARRHEIYRAIFRRYGGSRVTLLSMQNTYRGRGAIRDGGLALGLDDEEIDEIAKNMWRFSARSIRRAMSEKPELSRFASDSKDNRHLNLLVDITERLDRLPRHISVHPCGVILGNSSLLSLTPTEVSGIGLPMSQFDKDDMDPMGFLKLDVLGVRMQSAMAYAVREAKRVSKKEIDLDAVPRDDADVYKLIRSTNTLGMFQIESPGQRELTGKHQPIQFNDLTLQISLFRPGPMKGNMIKPYLDGRHGLAQPDYLHPDLRPILEESYGIVVFHEQLMRIMQKMTGCTLARAAAWLKTHYPTEFIAGLLTHDPGMYPKRLLLAEARRIGVQILPIDINHSSNEYLVEKTKSGIAVRMALTDIAGISIPEIERIICEQPFVDVSDFYIRARPSRRTIERLVLIGALDELAGITKDSQSNRSDLLVYVRQLTARRPKPLDQNQLSFELGAIQNLPSGNTAPTKEEVLAQEIAITGMDISEHELQKFQQMLDELGVVRANELTSLRSNTEVMVAGVRVATQTPPMRSGKRVVFISLDDGTGCADATFFDEAQRRCSHLLFQNRLLLISGKTRRTGVRGVSILAENAWDLRQLWRDWESGSYSWLKMDSSLMIST